MRKLLFFSNLGGLLLLLLLALAHREAKADEWLKITLTDVPYPPLVFVNTPNTGILTDIVRESFRLAKVQTEFLPMPNNRAITGLLLGAYDGSYGWAHSPERDEKLLFSSKPIYSFRMVFFQKNGTDIYWNSIRDLARYRIGTTLGNYYFPEFEALVASGVLRVDPADTDIANFNKLLRDRIQLFPIDVDVGLYLLKNNFSLEERKKITYQDKAFAVVPVYVVIRRDLRQAVELRDRFDRGFQQLVESGNYRKMVETYQAGLKIQQ